MPAALCLPVFKATFFDMEHRHPGAHRVDIVVYPGFKALEAIGPMSVFEYANVHLRAKGLADGCGMTRALICDPEMPSKAGAGRFDDIRACIGCNQACIHTSTAAFRFPASSIPKAGARRCSASILPRTARVG